MKRDFEISAILILVLCVSAVALGSGIPLVNATFHTGDIYVGAEETFVIEGSFEQEGSIIVRENGKLILKGASLVIIQKEGLPYSVRISGNGTLEVSDSYVSSTLYTPIALCDNAVAKIQNSTFGGSNPIEPRGQSLLDVSDSQISAIYAADYANVAVFDSEVYAFSSQNSSTLSLLRSSTTSIDARDQAVVNVTNSFVTLTFWTRDLTKARMLNSTISSLSASGESNVHLNQSSINSISVVAAADVLLSDGSKVQFCELTVDDSMLYLSGIKEGNFTYASIGLEPYGWKVTVDTSTINSITLRALHKSSLIISNSTLSYVDIFSSSTATIIDSQLHWLDRNDDSVAVLLNTQIDYIDGKDESKIIELSGYVAPYVFYETLALTIVGIIILMSICFFLLLRLKKKPYAAKP